MTNFNSVVFAVKLEKSMDKGIHSLVSDFIRDIEKANPESVKKSLKDALKKAGFVPSNCFSMKTLNSAIALFNAGIKADDVSNVMSFVGIKPSQGEKMTEKKIAENVKKFGTIAELIKQAKDAQTPDAKKAKKTESAKKGAQTRTFNKKGGIIPNPVVKANQNAGKTSEQPLQQQATPTMKIDRAINCFLALTDDERMAFYNAVRKELNDVVLTASKAKMKKAS